MDTKWFLLSKTIIGIIIMVLPTVLPMFGVNTDSVDLPGIGQHLNGILVGVGGILAALGRKNASKPITLLPK